MHAIRLLSTCVQSGECFLREHYSLSLLTPYRKHTLVTSEGSTLFVWRGTIRVLACCHPLQRLKRKCISAWLNVCSAVWSCLGGFNAAKKAPVRTLLTLQRSRRQHMSIFQSVYQCVRGCPVKSDSVCRITHFVIFLIAIVTYILVIGSVPDGYVK